MLNAVRLGLREDVAQLRQCREFDHVLTVVQNNTVSGFGKLATYDSAFRIGAWLSLLPTKIYLHAGTLAGARKLGLDVSQPYLTLEQLPAPFRDLEPYEIEDALCIYKAALAGHGSANRGQVCGPTTREARTMHLNCI